MFANVVAARTAGVNLGFFSANTAYATVELSDGTLAAGGAPLRTLTFPNLFRYEGTPEEQLLGTRYEGGNGNLDRSAGRPVKVGADLRASVRPATEWLYTGAGVNDGDSLGQIAGYEVGGLCTNDSAAQSIWGNVPCSSPPGVVHVLAASNAEAVISGSRQAHTVSYSTPEGAFVFSTGTIQWSWGVDNYTAQDPEALRMASRAAKQVTRNVFERFVDGDHVDVIARGYDNAMYWRARSRGQWSEWASLGGSFIDGPAMVAHADGRVQAFGIGADGALYDNELTTEWRDWQSLSAPPGVQLDASPAAVAQGFGNVEVLALVRKSDHRERADRTIGNAQIGPS